MSWMRRFLRRPAKSRGMTLVEMMVATLLTALIMIMLWKLIGSGSQAAAYGTWYSSRIAELRNGLRMAREDLAKSTYPSVITPTTVTVTEADANFYIGYKTGQTPAGGTVDILRFHICKPDRSSMPAPENLPLADITCTLQMRGTVLHYEKAGTGDVKPEETFDRDLIRDVEWVKCDLIEKNGTDGEASLVITVRVRHPWQLEKGAEERTVAKLAIKRKTI